EPLPVYQQVYGLSGGRQTPDVSFLADPSTGVPVLYTFGLNGQSGWFKAGGTSLGSASFAGVFALVNQARRNRSFLPLTNSEILYNLYNALGVGTSYANCYYDII